MKDVNGVSEEDLKKSLLGLDNYFFLINDTNNELNQHFNPDYESLFDAESFLDNYNFKNELFSKDFKYYYFIVPDKSVVCKEFLPFESNYLKRNIDLIEGIIDFTDYLDTDDYFKYDSHINFQGSKKLTFKFLNYIDNNFTIEQYNKLIDDADRIDIIRYYDMMVQRNWSYSEEFRNEFPDSEVYSLPKSKGLKSVEDFPEVFKMCGSRESFYYKNEDSFSDLRVLIFGDSTFELYGFYMSLYFKEIFFYWDHGKFNIDLIRWFNPDLIIEIRIERFIENLPVPDWILNKENIDLSREYLMNKLFEENRSLKVKLKKVKTKNKNLKLKLKEVNNENHDGNVLLKKVKGKNSKMSESIALKDTFKNLFKTNKSYIKVTKITTQGNRISYEFETSNDLDEYFIKKSMFIEYIYPDNHDLSKIPQSVLAIPLISNLLPVIWLTDSKLIVDELDETFYNCIPKLKDSYSCMYESASFKGKVRVKNIIANSYEYEHEYISLFSYGVDSLNTVLEYIDAKPMLFTLWGADISLDRKHGWKAVKNNIEQFAKDYDLTNFFVKSDFRKFMNTDRLFELYGDSLKNNGNWWYAVQHGIAFLSQVAMMAYIFKVKNILIASSYYHEKEDVLNKTNIIPCASSPIIDNEFKFASGTTSHEGWNLTRAQKIQNIIDYSKENNVKFNLHVCWHSPLGINCNICEKCARTYMYMMAIGENPNDYGFNVNDNVLHQVETNFKKVVYKKKNIGGWSMHVETLYYWKENQKIFKQNEEYWKNTAMKWIFDVDFDALIEDNVE